MRRQVGGDGGQVPGHGVVLLVRPGKVPQRGQPDVSANEGAPLRRLPVRRGAVGQPIGGRGLRVPAA